MWKFYLFESAVWPILLEINIFRYATNSVNKVSLQCVCLEQVLYETDNIFKTGWYISRMIYIQFLNLNWFFQALNKSIWYLVDDIMENTLKLQLKVIFLFWGLCGHSA